MLEKEIALLRIQIESEWEIPEDKTEEEIHTLWGSFPELRAITDEEIEEAESIWSKHLEDTIREVLPHDEEMAPSRRKIAGTGR